MGAVEVFNIRDYGATESADIGPAVQDAFDAAVAAMGGTVYIPPAAGGSWLWQSGVIVNLLDSVQGMQLVGEGTASLIRPYLPGSTILSIGNNAGAMRIANLVFQGDPLVATDVSQLMQLQTIGFGQYVLECCGLYGLEASADACALVNLSSSTAIVRACRAGASRTLASRSGVFGFGSNSGGVVLEGCVFTDYGYTHAGPGAAKAGGRAWVWVGQTYSGPSPGASVAVDIRNCLFDELQECAVLIDPEGAGRVGPVSFDGCGFNTQTEACVRVIARADEVAIRRCSFRKGMAPILLADPGAIAVLRMSGNLRSNGNAIVYSNATTVRVDT